MERLQLFRTMARYNRWMNDKLYAVCADMPDEERKRDRGAFFKSVHGILNHLLLADRIWLGRFIGQPFKVSSLDQELYADLDELRRERAKTDDGIDAWVASLSEETLSGNLRYTSIVNPEERETPLWFTALHFFNHQTHPRGQLTTLLWGSECWGPRTRNPHWPRVYKSSVGRLGLPPDHVVLALLRREGQGNGSA